MNMQPDIKQLNANFAGAVSDADSKYKWALKKMHDKDNMINRQKLEIRRLKEVVARMKGIYA